MKSRIQRWLGVAACCWMMGGCVLPPTPGTAEQLSSNPLTQGNVQLTLKPGITTKAEVLEVFGAPNITTRDGQGRETWTYQRNASVSRASSQTSWATILLVGASSASSGFERSSRTLTLIIKFDQDDVVTDFRSRSSEF